MPELIPIKKLLLTLPQRGRVKWIGVRPARGEKIVELPHVELLVDVGLDGDRFSGRTGNPRQVTLIQVEHLAVIAGCLGLESVQPATLRRNIAVSGLNLLALKGKYFKVGDALLEYTGMCHPCSKMERLLGPGGYNAVRGHGGITARVCESGSVALEDQVFYQPIDDDLC